MLKLKRINILVCATVFLTGFSFLLYLGSRSPDKGKVIEKGDSVSCLADDRPWLRDLGVGFKEVFEVEWENHSEIQFSILGITSVNKDKKTLNVGSSLNSEVTKILLYRENGRSYSWLSFDNVRFEATVNEKASEVLKKNIMKALEYGFLIESDSTGRVLNHYQGTGLDEFTSNYLLSFVSAIQFVTPKKFEKQWRTRERDSSGEFEALYSKEHPKDAFSFIKKKIDYADDSGSKNSFGRILTSITGQFRYVLSEECRSIERVTGSERIVKYLASAGGKMGESISTLEMKRQDNDVMKSSDLSILMKKAKKLVGEEEKKTALTTKEDKETGVSKMFRDKLGNTSYEDLIASTNNFQDWSEEQKKQDRTELYLKIKSYVYLYPKLLADILEDLRPLDLKNEGLSLWTTALSAIGSEQAVKHKV